MMHVEDPLSHLCRAPNKSGLFTSSSEPMEMQPSAGSEFNSPSCTMRVTATRHIKRERGGASPGGLTSVGEGLDRVQAYFCHDLAPHLCNLNSGMVRL
jgi:hypothetical protein